MPVWGTGNASVGAPFAACEFEDWTGTITLASGKTLITGQAVYRDATQVVGIQGQVGTSLTSSNSDIVVAGDNANAAANSMAYGVYQGPNIANPTTVLGVNQPATVPPGGVFTLLFRQRGAGIISASVKTLGTSVLVNSSNMFGEPGTDALAIAVNNTTLSTAVHNSFLGIALASGPPTNVTLLAEVLIPVPASTTTTAQINADIRIT